MRPPKTPDGGPEIRVLLRQLEIQLKDAWMSCPYTVTKVKIEDAKQLVHEMKVLTCEQP